MKVAAILVASAFVLGSASATATEQDTNSILQYCNEKGQACWQIKRAAEAAAEALATPDAEPCAGAGCDLIKRAEDDLLAKVNEVYDAYSSDKEIKDVFIEKREPKIQHASFAAKNCGQVRGQPCHKLKRAAEAIAEALAEPNIQHASFAAKNCGQVRGQPCHKLKREAKIQHASFAAKNCGQVRGQPCHKARRDLEALSAYANSFAPQDDE